MYYRKSKRKEKGYWKRYTGYGKLSLKVYIILYPKTETEILNYFLNRTRIYGKHMLWHLAVCLLGYLFNCLLCFLLKRLFCFVNVLKVKQKERERKLKEVYGIREIQFKGFHDTISENWIRNTKLSLCRSRFYRPHILGYLGVCLLGYMFNCLLG